MTGVLVTGATTPVGRALVDELLADPDVAHVLAVGVEPAPSGIPLDGGRVSYVRADLTRSRDLRWLLFGPARELGVTAVVHAALHRAARDRDRRDRRIHALNVESTAEMLHLAERHPTIRRFVYRSTVDVYRIASDAAHVLDEEHPLDLSPGAPQWVRDRVEADLTVCTRMGLSPLRIAVLRGAEILAPDSGSQLWDYLRSRVCFRPLGYDPMINLLSIEDAARALALAVRAGAQGIFNVPGRDTLPLSEIIEKAGRVGVAVPGPLLSPLYGLRALLMGMQFRYDMNAARFHWNGVLDGTRARDALGYEPRSPIDWFRLAERAIRRGPGAPSPPRPGRSARAAPRRRGARSPRAGARARGPSPRCR